MTRDTSRATRRPSWAGRTRRARTGSLLSNNFNVIYRFKEVIGADRGELTQCVRIDGDHGHPIIETEGGLNTAFDTYVLTVCVS